MRFFFNPVSGQLNAGPPREIVYADTAPLYPQEGSRWFDTINLREYVYTGTEWVESGVGPAGVKGDTGEQGPVGPIGPVGATGPQGPAATISVGTTTTGEPGASATVANSGTSGAAVLNFTIPRGAVGQTGAVGPVGPQGPQGVKGDVGNTGPQGIQGVQGPKGDVGVAGPAGAAATVSVGTTTTGSAGTSAAVTNSGSSSAAVFNFTIPRGAVGNTGPQGPQGPAGADGTSVKLKGSVAQVSNLPTAGNVAGDLWVVTATGDGYVWSGSSWSNVGPIRGPVGPAGATGGVGPAGEAATVSVGTTTTGAAGTNAAVTNSGTTSAAVFNFTVPRGATGEAGPQGPQGFVGPQGPQGVKGDVGNTGPQGPAGPAPAGTGAVVVSNGVLGTPVGYGTTNIANTLVQRDSSGNFLAGIITGNLTGNVTGGVTGNVTGNASTASKLATAQTINVSGDVTGTAQSFDGSAAITIPTAIAPGVIVNADINAAAAISDTKLATISTAGKVSNSATTATSANTNSAIVARDTNGNFSAGTITASLFSGNATSASSAAKLTTARTINGTSFDGSANITITAAPTSHTHPFSEITDSPYKDGVTVATTAALTANYANGTSGVGATLTNSGTLAALVIDGVTASVGMRVLVKNQASTFQNGNYSVTTVGSTAAAWVLTRATDSDSNAELGGAIVSVDRGTSGGKLFSTSFKTTDTVGTTACVWQQIYDQGDGILLAPWTTKTAAYTAVAGDRIVANTTAAAFTITLPATPAAYTEIVFADHYNQWAARNLTIARNGQNIEGLAENLICNVEGVQFTMRYEGTTWRIYT